jgi:hypothetical protein
MSLLVSDLINTAVGRAYPFIRETDIAPGQLCKILTGLDQEVLHWYSIQAPERTTTVAAPITVVLSQNVAGYALVALAYVYTNFKWIDNQGFVWPINMVPENRFDHPGKHPAALVRNSTFYPCDPNEVRWTNISGSIGGQRQFFAGNGDTITYDYQPIGPNITTTSQNMTSPDEAREYFTSSLTFHILLNSSEMIPQGRLAMAQASMALRRQELLTNMLKRTQTQGRAFEQV